MKYFIFFYIDINISVGNVVLLFFKSLDDFILKVFNIWYIIEFFLFNKVFYIIFIKIIDDNIGINIVFLVNEVILLFFFFVI